MVLDARQAQRALARVVRHRVRHDADTSSPAICSMMAVFTVPGAPEGTSGADAGAITRQTGVILFRYASTASLICCLADWIFHLRVSLSLSSTNRRAFRRLFVVSARHTRTYNLTLRPRLPSLCRPAGAASGAPAQAGRPRLVGPTTFIARRAAAARALLVHEPRTRVVVGRLPSRNC